ncbi:SMI1/KNR4 family protein [Chryseobacterium zhengzhouense]|uniref:SMI1/KNR4 family protein n=1 Tax=Chryseobacterium zhengzhouense TaxID=1636086 RepID=A0ABW2M452_9FLAO
MKLINAFPKLNEKLLAKVESTLEQRFGYKNIPTDYKNFLLNNNGGYVSPGYIDDTDDAEHTQEVVFETSLKWVRMNNAPVEPALICFFGVWLEDDMNEDEVENWDLPELILSNANSKEDFDVLPDHMMSIASCQHPDASDILCISLDEQDYGSIYYNYGMCDHPSNFHGDFYEKAVNIVLQKHHLSNEDTYNLDEENPNDRKIINELKRATFVKVGNSFTEFLENCKIIDVETA